MNETQIINEAYADKIAKLFTILFDSLVTAQNDDQRKQAEQRFQNGVKVAREIRDRAIALLA